MWLMTKHGFYSIVRKKQGEFHVRARVRKDLENLQERDPLAGREIQASKETHYPYRLVVGQAEVLKMLRFLGETLDYSNFKDTVADTPDQAAKHDLYAQFWGMALRSLGGLWAKAIRLTPCLGQRAREAVGIGEKTSRG